MNICIYIFLTNKVQDTQHRQNQFKQLIWGGKKHYNDPNNISQMPHVHN